MDKEEWNRRIKEVLELNEDDSTESGKMLDKCLTNLLVDEEEIDMAREEYLEITGKEKTIEIPSTRISKEEMDSVQEAYKRSFPAWQKEHEPDWKPDC
tara:strand:- start:1959 stop:2252 length:294 start_codon:yes stop_codon:yes gene_type:complete